MERRASCACGRLRVLCRGEPEKVSLCWCQACQRRTGSAFSVAVFFKREAVVVNGPARMYERDSDSGFPVRFHICQTCGSSVLWEPARKPDYIGVAIGAFADPAFPAPTQQVYAEHRAPWISVALESPQDAVG